ncbi:hypothetical protein Pcinc_008053 [Petrolisthes cinctipes]|uniref:Uncharacterized protein n=1 Tax=Petrolisthes cinctipes TaxID=88211 RepID=A0AAE1KXP2_PETCI|nr:hypothetical protein Pcinc_008053 [Petrolisthes cinctipes]
MQQLNEKASTPFNDYMLRIRHSMLLPIIIQLHLQALPNLTLLEYGKRADDLMSTYKDGAHWGPTQHTTATITTPTTPTTEPPPLTYTQLQPPTLPPQPTPPLRQQPQVPQTHQHQYATPTHCHQHIQTHP